MIGTLRQGAGGGASDIEQQSDQDRPAPPETVGDGADHRLPQAEAQEKGRQRLLDHRNGRVEIGRDGRQRRQVEVDADRREDGEHPEQGDQFDPLRTGEGIAGGGGHDRGMGRLVPRRKA